MSWLDFLIIKIYNIGEKLQISMSVVFWKNCLNILMFFYHFIFHVFRTTTTTSLTVEISTSLTTPPAGVWFKIFSITRVDVQTIFVNWIFNKNSDNNKMPNHRNYQLQTYPIIDWFSHAKNNFPNLSLLSRHYFLFPLYFLQTLYITNH